ncbi:MAG TPA: transglycosylase domain-containing protein, partial [Anseongella sp.]|nr:transglycosylase domain-containing protein [Anseongella sp.]
RALIATEDARFFSHSGIDLVSVLSSAWSTLGGNPRGASTITQQLAKNLYQTRRKRTQGIVRHLPLAGTIIYKTKEWLTAIKLELIYSKEEILSLYLNTVSFGNNAFGIKVAADQYFGKSVKELETHEAALLVGILKATSTYNPVTNPENARARRDIVLSQMLKYGYINRTDYEEFINKPLSLKTEGEENEEAESYIRAAVRRWLKPWAEENGVDIYSDGLRIYTTIDSRMQKYAEEAVNEHMKLLQQRFDRHWQDENPWVDDEGKEIEGFIKSLARGLPEFQALMKKFGDEDTVFAQLSQPREMTVFSWDGDQKVSFSPLDSLAYYARFLHTGLLSLEARTGHIKAWVGGIDFRRFKYDHVDQAKRQAGSTFKPFVYLAAIDNGYSPCDKFVDKPVTINYVENGEAKSWSPKNSDWVFTGYEMSLRWAMGKSCNSVTAQLTEEVGWDKVVEYAHKTGIQSELKAIPSVGLGTNDVSLLEMVSAYGVFLNQGLKTDPVLVSHITDLEGNIIARFEPETKRVISAETGWLMQYMLRGGMEEPGGTSQALWEYDLWQNGNQIGGKTGTTSNYSDGWYIGLTKDLVTGVWVGASDRHVHFRNSATGEGSKTALPVFGKFMEKVYDDPATGYTFGKFPEPEAEIKKRYRCPSYVPVPDTLETDSLFFGAALGR